MWALKLQHAGSLVEARELGSCGAWAQLPCGMWDPSSPIRDGTGIARRILYHGTTREVPSLPFLLSPLSFQLWS